MPTPVQIRVLPVGRVFWRVDLDGNLWSDRLSPGLFLQHSLCRFTGTPQQFRRHSSVKRVLTKLVLNFGKGEAQSREEGCRCPLCISCSFLLLFEANVNASRNVINSHSANDINGEALYPNNILPHNLPTHNRDVTVVTDLFHHFRRLCLRDMKGLTNTLMSDLQDRNQIMAPTNAFFPKTPDHKEQYKKQMRRARGRPLGWRHSRGSLGIGAKGLAIFRSLSVTATGLGGRLPPAWVAEKGHLQRRCSMDAEASVSNQAELPPVTVMELEDAKGTVAGQPMPAQQSDEDTVPGGVLDESKTTKELETQQKETEYKRESWSASESDDVYGGTARGVPGFHDELFQKSRQELTQEEELDSSLDRSGHSERYNSCRSLREISVDKLAGQTTENAYETDNGNESLHLRSSFHSATSLASKTQERGSSAMSTAPSKQELESNYNSVTSKILAQETPGSFASTSSTPYLQEGNNMPPLSQSRGQERSERCVCV